MNEKKDVTNSLLDYCDKIPENPSTSFDTLLLFLKEQIAGHFGKSIPEIQCVDYRHVEEANAKGVSGHKTSDYLPADATPDEQYVTYQVFLLRQENLRILGSRFLHEGDRILEIGAGLLDQAGDSNVSSAFPKPIAEGFSFCDINPTVVEQSLKNHPQAPIKESDILRLKRDYPLSSFDCVIGVNVVDTLLMEDLLRCLKEISYVLKPEGTFIHFMNMEPFIYALVHNLMKEEEMLIPLLDKEGDRRFLSIDKEVYRETVRDKLIAQGVSKEKISLLDYVTTLSRVEQERFCNTIIFNDSDHEYAALGRLMLPWGKTITPMDYYEGYMKEALEATGFRLDECHYAISEKDVRASIGSANDEQIIIYGPTGKQSKPDESLGWGQSHFKILTHAIIATIYRT